MRRPLVLTLASALWLATPALAGIGGRNGEIGFDFGYASLDEDLTDQGGARFAFRGGYHFNNLFQVEGQELGLAAVEETSGVDVTTSVAAFMINGVFNFHAAKGDVVPYVLGGVGFSTTRIDVDPGGDADDTGGAWHVAAGSRFFFGKNKRAAVRVELSRLVHKTSGLVIGGFLPGDDRFTENSLTAGFTWRLGDER